MRKYMKDNADNIINRRPFKESSIEGYTYKDTAAYVINSYTTPIAIYTNDTWYLNTQKYSQTTTMQQHALRLILDNEHTVASTPEMFTLRIRALQGLPRPNTIQH